MESSKQEEKSKSKPNDEQHKSEHTLFFGYKKALYGGVLAGSIALGGQWLVGLAYSGYEARQLLESLAASALYLGSSVVTASATILALMLTILGLTKQTESEFKTIFFERIKRIGLLSTIALSGGILLLLFLSIPLQESDNIPTTYFDTIYYILIIFIAALSGSIVAIVLMLYNAITSVIDVVRPKANEEIDGIEVREDQKSGEEEEETDESAE